MGAGECGAGPEGILGRSICSNQRKPAGRGRRETDKRASLQPEGFVKRCSGRRERTGGRGGGGRHEEGHSRHPMRGAKSKSLLDRRTFVWPFMQKCTKKQ